MKTKGAFLSKWTQVVAAGIVITVSGTAFAGIANTKHNLGSTGTAAPATFSGTTEICVFCHTPHGANVTSIVPLWNKTFVSNTFTTYDDLGTSTLDGKVVQPGANGSGDNGSVSIACLTCHDGTQAMNNVVNAPGSGLGGNTLWQGGSWVGTTNAGAMNAGIANLGKDLTNDHPISIQYAGGGITASSSTMNDSDFIAPEVASFNGNITWWVDTEAVSNGTREKTDMQLYTRNVESTLQPFVECASCHDPHVENATFLRLSTGNNESKICLACHDK